MQHIKIISIALLESNYREADRYAGGSEGE